MKNIFVVLLIAAALTACTKTEETEIERHIDGPKVEKAIASLHGLGDNKVDGIVTFEQTPEGVKVDAKINGLSNSKHGFHIHQYGDCTAEDGTSAGGHFNPDNMEHSGPEAMKRHMGDMGNLQGAGENAVSTISYTDKTISLSEILGRGVIIHAGTDDLKSQPSGAAGPRISCGVIGITK